jgi:hypothetical protein
MRRCPHTGLSTRFKMYYECEQCRREERKKMRRLIQALNPLRWFRRASVLPIGADGRVRSLPIRDGGVGLLESAEKVPSLIDVARLDNRDLDALLTVAASGPGIVERNASLAAAMPCESTRATALLGLMRIAEEMLDQAQARPPQGNYLVDPLPPDNPDYRSTIRK